MDRLPQDTNTHTAKRVQKTDSEVQDFYDGKKVFLTGGTGFLGKLLVEKLLRSTNVSTIYFLIRNKKNRTLHTRLDEYFDDVVFQRLKNEAPNFKHKIVGIPGDCVLPGLGISIEDRELLITNVDVVFHVAATVNFTEKLKLAYAINVKATEQILDLCREMTNLKACVYVSSIYAQSHLKEIDEVFYETTVNYKDLGVILEKFDEKNITKYTPKIVGASPNTYTFTKALAESLIKDQGAGLPIGIFRPAIVISTYKEPMEAWVDNMYGPTGFCAGSMSGVIRTVHFKRESLANIVPADTCVAALIVSAWDVANRTYESTASNIPIYNYISSSENPITWGEFHSLNKLYMKIYPMSKAMWSVQFQCSENETIYNLKKILYHFVPAVLMDTLCLFRGKKPSIVKLYSKIHKFAEVMTYFSTRDWNCTNHNVVNLWHKLNQTDKDLFPFSMAMVHWTAYFKTYLLGIRLYILKDADQTLPEAKIRHSRFRMLHSLLKFTFSFMVTSWLWNTIYRNVRSRIPQMELL